jgi:hypothetical protein
LFVVVLDCCSFGVGSNCQTHLSLNEA